MTQMAFVKYKKLKYWGSDFRMQKTIISGKKYNNLSCQYCKNVVYCKEKKGINPKENYCHWTENRFEQNTSMQ